MIQRFEIWIDVLGVVPDDAMEQIGVVRQLFQDLGFLPETEKSKRGGCDLVGVNRVGSQMRVTLENKRGYGRSAEPVIVKTEAMLAFLCPGLHVDPRRLQKGYPVDLRTIPVEPHSVEDLRYYMTELLSDRAKVRAARGEPADFRFVNVLARGMRGVERIVGGNLGPIARNKPS